MTLNLTSYDAAMKQHYTDDIVQDLVYEDNSYLALRDKMEEFGGRNMPIPAIFANPGARSAAFTTAQNRDTQVSSQLAAFLLTRVKDYSLATIDGETMDASEGDGNAFMEAATVEVDGAIKSLTRSIAVKQFRDGTGSVANIAGSSTQTTFATSVLQFANPEDVVNFEVNDQLDFATSSTGSVKSHGSNGTGCLVIAVDRANGNITVGNLAGAAVNLTDTTYGCPTIAVGDFIFKTGDAANGGTNVCIAGREAWNPYTTPASNDSFFSQNRSKDPTRLAGSRRDGTTESLNESLTKGLAQVSRESGKIDEIYMSYKQFAALETDLGSKRQYVDIKTDSPMIGFRGIQLTGPKGSVDIIPDQNCPTNRAYGIYSKDVKLCSIGKAVKVENKDGLTMLRQSAADGVEVRYKFYGNEGTWNTKNALNIQLPI